VTEFVTPSALSAETGISPDLLRSLAARGRLPGARRLGRRWLIHRPTFVASFEGALAPPARLAAVTRPHRLPGGTLARIASSV
jgi:hypothetical protein